MCFNYKSINDFSRDVHFLLKPPYAAADHNVLSEYKWYRFSGEFGGQLPTTCVVENHCGAQAPGWLNGSLPSREAGIVRREVCFYANEDCCHTKTTVFIRQCVGYFVYVLQNVPLTIRGRYCVDTEKGKRNEVSHLLCSQ